MAGAGYKLFNTGDVLTAAQVNTYLQEQTVMVFADATARTTALSGVLAEGMVTYLKDTNAIEKYTGAAWVNIDSGSTSPLTTKGDLYTYSTADARLAVGNNGETLVADSSTTTGLRWQGDWNTGKNKIINGDFGIWQRGTSFTSPSSAYTADRFVANAITSDVVSQQSFTPGNPISGYEPQYFLRYATSANAGTRYFFQKVEDVRTLAGQTVTFSFWAKVNSGTATLTSYFYQIFGSGGSGDVQSSTQNNTVTTSWQRFSFTITMPSVSGKTIGANSLVQAALSFSDTSKNIDLWGFQLEAGSVATPFTTATGTLAGELAACQRYYYRQSSNSSNAYAGFALGTATATTTVDIPYKLAQTMRIAPTLTDYANLAVSADNSTLIAVTNLAIVSTENSADSPIVRATVTGATQFRPYGLFANNNTNAYVGFSAEL